MSIEKNKSSMFIYNIEPYYIEYDILKEIKETLDNNGVIVYPTDTNYGIGCKVDSKKAISKIYRIKQLPKEKLLTIIFKDIQQLQKYTYLTNDNYKLIKKLTPGPFTFILKANKYTPKLILSKRNTIGARIVDDYTLNLILDFIDYPLINTTASFKDNNFNCIKDMYNHFKENINIYLDKGCISSEPSTIIDLTNIHPEIIRQGKGKISLK